MTDYSAALSFFKLSSGWIGNPGVFLYNDSDDESSWDGSRQSACFNFF